MEGFGVIFLVFAFIAVLPVVTPFAFFAWWVYLKHKEQRGLTDKRFKELEERVRTLEDIVMTGDYEMQRKFRRLEQDEARVLPAAAPPLEVERQQEQSG